MEQKKMIRVFYKRDGRTPIAHVFAPLDYDAQHCPRMMQPQWEEPEHAEAYMDRVLERFSLTDRGIVIMPMGKVPGWYPSSQWHTGEEWRQELLIRRLNNWKKEKRDRTIELFTGFRVSDPHHLQMVKSQPPDPNQPHLLHKLLANIEPWITQIPIHRWWMDHASHPINIDIAIRVASWLRRQRGLIMGVEAYPRLLDKPDKPLDIRSLQYVPAYAITRFVMNRDPDHKWQCPDNCEMLIILRNPENPTQEWVDSYRSRGFVVGSLSAQLDKLVI
ncbi:MAG: hypothetical protein ACW99G_23375 [Candidatus Thorarchaeota archaeon]